MKRKMYILRTWTYGFEYSYRHSKLSVYVTDGGEIVDGKRVPYITTDRLRAKKFYTKKDALRYASLFEGCRVDCVWHYTEYNKRLNVTYDLWS